MSKKNKEAAEKKDEEQAQLEEPSSSGKSETQSLLLRIENSEKENRELREQLEEGKVEERVLGSDTLVGPWIGPEGEISWELCA